VPVWICISDTSAFSSNASPSACVIPYVVVFVTAFELGVYLGYAECSKLTGVCTAPASFQSQNARRNLAGARGIL